MSAYDPKRTSEPKARRAVPTPGPHFAAESAKGRRPLASYDTKRGHHKTRPLSDSRQRIDLYSGRVAGLRHQRVGE